MSFSNAAENEILNYVFKGTNTTWDGDTNLYLALHTADPGEAGSATSSECAYGSYARVTMTRSSDWTISGNQVANANLEQFPQCSSGTETITHVSIVNTSTGAGLSICRAELNTPIPISTGIQPQFAAGALTFTLD